MKRFGDLHKARQAFVSMAARRAVGQSAMAFLDSVAADVHFAIRGFRRAPGFVLAVVLVAGLGIGISTAVFSILDAFLLRPLPVPKPDGIVRVYTNESRHDQLYGASSYLDYLNVRHVPALRGLAAYVPLAAHLRLEGPAVRAEGRLVSENFFEVLGVAAGVGRVLSAGDAASSDAVPVVLGHAFWRRHFARDSAAVGRSIGLNGASAIVVGVMPAAFTGVEPSQVDVYVPLGRHATLAPGMGLSADRGGRFVRLIGRVAPGANEARAAGDLNVIMAALADRHPDTNRGRVMTVTRGSALVDTRASSIRFAPIAALVFSITGVLLLITTVNVAGFLLARMATRSRELEVRLSLGGARSRIFRQLVTESLVLGAAAETVALGLLAVLPAVARALSVPEALQFGVDARVLAFASLVAMATALGFSIGPALMVAAQKTFHHLREGAATMPPARARAQRALVTVQVALSIVLLGSAVLLAQSIRRQYAVDTGLDVERVLAAEFEAERGSPSRDDERGFARESLRKVRQMPGVIAASVATVPPLTSEGARTTIDVPGFGAPAGALNVPFTNVGHDYCAALGLRIVEGGELRSAAAVLPRAVLVNQTMARMYWPGRSPVGASIRLGGAPVPVIAVVADAPMVALSRPAGPHFFVQTESDSAFALLIRTRMAAAPMKPLIQRTFASGVNGYVLTRVRSMDEVIGNSLAETRAFATAASAVSLLALFLAMSALSALVSYLAAQRTREFGIRLALGATHGDVMRLVLAFGARLSAIGVGIGLLAMGVIAALLQSILPVSPLDAATLVAAALAAGAVAVAACTIPAVRAARALPAHTLRVE